MMAILGISFLRMRIENNSKAAKKRVIRLQKINIIFISPGLNDVAEAVTDAVLTAAAGASPEGCTGVSCDKSCFTTVLILSRELTEYPATTIMKIKPITFRRCFEMTDSIRL